MSARKILVKVGFQAVRLQVKQVNKLASIANADGKSYDHRNLLYYLSSDRCIARNLSVHLPSSNLLREDDFFKDSDVPLNLITSTHQSTITLDNGPHSSEKFIGTESSMNFPPCKFLMSSMWGHSSQCHRTGRREQSSCRRDQWDRWEVPMSLRLGFHFHHWRLAATRIRCRSSSPRR